MNRTTLFIILTTCLVSGSHSLTCSESATYFENTVCDSEDPAFITEDEVFYNVKVDGYTSRLITGGLTSSADELSDIQQFQKRYNVGVLQVFDRKMINDSKAVYMFNNNVKTSLMKRLNTHPYYYVEEPEELFKFMYNLLLTLSTFESKNFVLRNLKIGNILLTASGYPLIYDLTDTVYKSHEEYVPYSFGYLSYGENIDIINGHEHSSVFADDTFKAGLLMYYLMTSVDAYVTQRNSSLQNLEQKNLYFSKSLNMKAIEICSQLLYSFNDNFDLKKLILLLYNSIFDTPLLKSSDSLSYKIKDGPEEAMNELKQKMRQANNNMQEITHFNPQNSSNQEYINQYNTQSPRLDRKDSEYVPSNLEKRMYYEQNYTTPNYTEREEEFHNNRGEMNNYGMPKMDLDYKQGSYINLSRSLDSEGVPTGFVIVIIFAVGVFLFNIAAIIFMMMSCRKDYFGLLVNRNDDLELSRV